MPSKRWWTCDWIDGTASARAPAITMARYSPKRATPAVPHVTGTRITLEADAAARSGDNHTVERMF